MRRVVRASAVLALFACVAARAGDGVGETSVLKWKDGKKAAFFLAFDDSCPSHVRHAIPELAKRGLVGTFYINPGNGPFQSQSRVWLEELPRHPAVVYGNHTFKHTGATNSAHLDAELARCHDVIYGCYPARRKPFLVSFGRPGGVPWTVSEDEKRAALARYNLVERPPFFSYPFHVKDQAAVCARVDEAVEKGEAGHLDFHGVGGDWLSIPLEIFTALLDTLEARRDEVWVTDHVTCHKYQAERESARVVVAPSDGKAVRLALTCGVDPALYDEALTLETRVPPGWTKCRVTQGAASVERAAAGGRVRYAAVPGAGDVVISRSDAP